MAPASGGPHLRRGPWAGAGTWTLASQETTALHFFTSLVGGAGPTCIIIKQLLREKESDFNAGDESSHLRYEVLGRVRMNRD